MLGSSSPSPHSLPEKSEGMGLKGHTGVGIDTKVIESDDFSLLPQDLVLSGNRDVDFSKS